MLRVKIVLYILLLAVTGLGLTIWYQQQTIEALVHGQLIETYRANAASRELAQFRRELDTLQHGRALRLAKVERQADLLIAMRRGPSHARKMMKDKNIRFYLGL